MHIPASPRLRRQAGRDPSISTPVLRVNEPWPDRDEAAELGRRIRQGDVSARNELACRHLRLVGYFARRYARCGIDRSDIQQAGCLGLLRAASKFDPDRQVEFVTYAGIWIRSFMLRFVRAEKRRRPVTIDFNHAPGLLASFDVDQLERREILKRVRSAFHNLPRPQRVALGRSVGFMPAGETESKLPTVSRKQHKAELRRAKNNLRRHLGDLADDNTLPLHGGGKGGGHL